MARIVVEALYFADHELGHYKLGVWAVMPNHVHVLVLPKVSVSRFMQSLKGFTAREANKILKRTGQAFWQKESYDHWVRDEPERKRIVQYIENNPVKAGLAACPEAYPWSSAGWTMEEADHSRRGFVNRRRNAWIKGQE